MLALHRALLRLRGSRDVLCASDDCAGDAEALDADTIVLRRGRAEADSAMIVARLRGRGAVPVDGLSDGEWHVLLHTEEDPFAIDPLPPRVDFATGQIEFQRPGAMLLARTRTMPPGQ